MRWQVILLLILLLLLILFLILLFLLILLLFLPQAGRAFTPIQAARREGWNNDGKAPPIRFPVRKIPGPVSWISSTE
jgi:hypothetical protein